MKKFAALLTKEKGKLAMNEWENDDSDILRALYSVYKQKLGQVLFHTYLLICLMDKDTSVLLKVINTKLSIKTMVLTFLKILCICTQSL